jgi:queuine tRNA-ribosyltransferase
MQFTVQHKSKRHRGRAGVISTVHGDIKTPVFMPVGTLGTVKALTPQMLKEAGAEIVLGNTYHLYLRPGTEVIGEAGGLHKFMGWDRPLLTDSGGFQVFSLGGLRKITDEGVLFNSHLNGDQHLLTPEKVIAIQKVIGSDIMMPLDEVVPHPSDHAETEEAVERTTRWLKRSVNAFREQCDPEKQALFGIMQGGMYDDLRRRSVDELRVNELTGLAGYAIGGLSVGEPKDKMYPLIELSASLLPEEKPRYLMGVGEPEDIEHAVRSGVDMFDCVLPTRLARHGTMFSSEGKLNIDNARFQKDFTQPDKTCDCYTCRNFTRAYLRHLYMNREILAYVLMTLHNVRYLIDFTSRIRASILAE